MSAGVEPDVVAAGERALDDPLGGVAVDAVERGDGAVRLAQPLGALRPGGRARAPPTPGSGRRRRCASVAAERARDAVGAQHDGEHRLLARRRRGGARRSPPRPRRRSRSRSGRRARRRRRPARSASRSGSAAAYVVGGGAAEHVDRVRDARLRREQLARAPRASRRRGRAARGRRPRRRRRRGSRARRRSSAPRRGAPSARAGSRAARRRRPAPRASAARITPAWWKSASTAASEPASAAVCELAARCPVAVVPLLSARIGFVRATRRARRPKRRGLPNDSTYMSTTSVASSSSHHSSRSFVETSALLPIDTNAERPSPRDSAASSSARPSAPLCEEKPMLPAGAERAAKVAFRLGPATAMPRQFGPISRAPCERTSASSCSCRSTPSLPISAKPAEMTTSARTPLRSACSAASSTAAPGSEITARSTGVGDLLDRPVAAHAGDRLAVAVDRVGGAGEVAGEDVAEELAADRAAPPRGADDGDAPRLEERPQRGDDRHVVARVDVLAVALGRRDRELHLELAALELARQLEAGRLEDAEHGAVVRQHLGDEALDPDLGRALPRAARAAACRCRGPGARRRRRTPPRRASGRAGGRSSRRRRPARPSSSTSAPSSAPRSSQSGSSSGSTRRGPSSGKPWKRR